MMNKPVKIEHHRMPVSACPACGWQHDTATGWQGRQPAPGAFSLCVECGVFLKFGPALVLELADLDEIAARGSDFLAQLLAIRAHWVRDWAPGGRFRKGRRANAGRKP